MAMGLIAHLNRGRSCRGPGPLPDGEVLGRRFSKRLPPSKLLPTSSLRSTATNRTCPIKASGCILKDGSPIDISLTVSPMRNAAGKIVCASKVARDITERKRTDVQIAILAREAEHRAKNVLATVQATVQLSHSESRDVSRRSRTSAGCSNRGGREPRFTVWSRRSFRLMHRAANRTD